MVSRPTRGAADLSRAELRQGVPRLGRLVRTRRARVVAYTGKGVYTAAAGAGTAGWGRQPTSLFGPAIDFVLPSPSGLVRLTFDQKLACYRALSALRRELARAGPL